MRSMGIRKGEEKGRGREDVGRRDCEMASHGVVPQIKTAVWLP
jgi:hypothetical protein